MKELFSEFYKPASEEEFKALWKEAVFVLDTNVLLSLYRLPFENQSKILKTIGQLKNKIWLPYQVGLEFQRGRLEVICGMEETYTGLREILNDFEKQTLAHPFIERKQTQKKFKTWFRSIKNEMGKLDNDRPKWLKKDNILDKLNKILKGKIGNQYPETKLQEIYQVGTERYSKKIPPGYKDADKDKSNLTRTRKFGDLIIWFQIKDKAKQEKKPVIFVTNERKEDWWWIEKGERHIGARYELVKEFKDDTGQLFHLYELFNFLHFANKYLPKTNISDELIQKIKELKQPMSLSETSSSDNLAGAENNLGIAQAEIIPVSDKINLEISENAINKNSLSESKSETSNL